MIHISNENIHCDSRCKWYQENVLSCPKLLYYDVCSEKTFYMELILCLRDKTRWRQELGLIRSGASQFALWASAPTGHETISEEHNVATATRRYLKSIM